jgi:hypothetical protein
MSIVGFKNKMTQDTQKTNHKIIGINLNLPIFTMNRNRFSISINRDEGLN